jgi:hypothetical protein
VAPMETTDDTDEQAPSPTSQKRIRRRKKEVYGAHLDDMASWQLKSILDDMCAVYSEAQKEDIAFSDERERDDLRMRVDGQPSARAPAATLPVSHWATVLSPPDGGDYDEIADRLFLYQQQLEFWAGKGLYRGPTRLTYVNPESREDPGEPDAES